MNADDMTKDTDMMEDVEMIKDKECETSKIVVKKIPAHIVYSAEYDVNDLNDFFDTDTGMNMLYDLQFLMERENPNVHVPEIGEDYNYFEYPYEIRNSKAHVIYNDMVDCMGRDSNEGAYYFREMPEITAATMEHKGPFSSIEEAYNEICKWIEEQGYENAGHCRISAVHGPWDRDDESEYVNECQVAIK